MIVYLALGCLILGALLGVGGMKKAGRYAGKAWRPGAGMLSTAAFFAAAVLAVKDAWAPALILLGAGAWLAVSARRRPAAPEPPPTRDGMSLEDASAILGVAPDASPEVVSEAYRRLMQRVHPDKGGASGLAAQLNNARDVMTRRGGPPPS